MKRISLIALACLSMLWPASGGRAGSAVTSLPAEAKASEIEAANQKSRDSREECIQSANLKARELAAANRPQREIERAFQIALAACSGPGVAPEEAALAGSVNVDYLRLARAIAAGAISPAQYLQRVRDRSRKLKVARRDREYARSLASGDADGDFVPDDRDRCPRTPELEPTDDTGCPTRERPPVAPSSREMQRVLDTMRISASPNCKNAPVPNSSDPLKIGYDNVNRETLAMAVTAVVNQPGDCMVFYEIGIRLLDVFEGNKHFLPADAIGHFVFRGSDSEDKKSNPARRVFRIRKTDPDTGNRRFIFENLARYGRVEWRVRAINGNGQASKWSDWSEASGPSFGEP
ncbi:MAG TPA: hypothetical protein VNH22_17045 [Blastocatellia bacterium]|jgi:hypothetical protein|nr:hypothetical protein [Blastocatellia bacterium]